MEIRHLRCFMALAEELHFARAAAKLHIEQSPLSRTIKELEEELGAQLFIRNTRSTRLTRAGLMLMEHAPRVFASLRRCCINHPEAELPQTSDGFTQQRPSGVCPER